MRPKRRSLTKHYPSILRMDSTAESCVLQAPHLSWTLNLYLENNSIKCYNCGHSELQIELFKKKVNGIINRIYFIPFTAFCGWDYFWNVISNRTPKKKKNWVTGMWQWLVINQSVSQYILYSLHSCVDANMSGVNIYLLTLSTINVYNNHL